MTGTMARSNTVVLITTAWGIAFGLSFPVVAWGIEFYLLSLPWSLKSLISIHVDNPVNFIIACAPIVLGATFYVIGRKQASLLGYSRNLERRVEERTQELIEANAQLRNEIEARQRAEGVRDDFLSTVSHELRTPITSIKGSLGLIVGGVGGDLSEQCLALVKLAADNSDRLSLLIDDILDIQKMEAGEMEFDAKPLEMVSVLREAISANEGYGVQFDVSYLLETDLTTAKFEGDSDRMIQVLSNLLSNAAKFSPAGDVVVVGCEIDGDNIQVSVRDQGSGVPEEFSSRIFHKFAQADQTSVKLNGGTGLGLSITKIIVERHGGAVWFDSKPGQGATFYFNVPKLN